MMLKQLVSFVCCLFLISCASHERKMNQVGKVLRNQNKVIRNLVQETEKSKMSDVEKGRFKSALEVLSSSNESILVSINKEDK